MSSTLYRVTVSFWLGALILSAKSAVGAPATVPLGRASSFAVLGGSGVVSTGATAIVGNLGAWPGTDLVILSPGTVSGTLHTGSVAAADAQADLTTAYNDALNRSSPNPVVLPNEVGGLTLTGRLYAASALDITSGDLILDGQGNTNSVFIFQISGSFNVGASNRVRLTRGARAARIFWQVGDSVTIGPGSVVKGSILANQSINVQSRASVDGRVLARSGEVLLEAAKIAIPNSGPGPLPSGGLAVEAITSVAVNPQTGLLDQTLRVSNVRSNAIAAVQLLIRGLPGDVTVQNASGRTSAGTPYLQYNIPLAAGGSVDFVVEYARASRRTFEVTNLVANAVAPNYFFVSGGTPKAVTRAVPLRTGATVVEFSAIPGARYAVLYSDDRLIWKTARPAITASANRVLWIDEGPPKTESKPPAGRSYRVIRLR